MKYTEVQDCFITLLVVAGVHVPQKTGTEMDTVPEGATADVSTKMAEARAVG